MRAATSICIPVSPGELLDKVGILRLKAAHLSDASKLAHVRNELDMLEALAARDLPADQKLEALARSLDAINAQIWSIEDHLREHERQQDFGSAFVSLARSVYRLNDERAVLKRTINEHLGSSLVEVKTHGHGY
jgi:hypothetical protein